MSSVTSAVVFVGLGYHADSMQVCGLSREGKPRAFIEAFLTAQKVPVSPALSPSLPY
jgi:hypothetical protein